jgi:hypothetical protein
MATAPALAYQAPAGMACRGGSFPPGLSGALLAASAVGTGAVDSSNVVTPPVSVPAGGIPQYLTSDGGTAGVGSNYSGPTRDKWHNRLGFAWLRPNTMGNWLDASQVQEGSTPFASSAPITTVGQRVSITATALVARWLANGQNRGTYLRITSGSLFPVAFHGRTDPTSGLRPTLTVVTSTGTTVLTAQCNAWWQSSSFQAAGSALEWRLASGQSPAILRFDVSAIAGTLNSATLEFSVKAFPSGGSTGQVVALFEADPPAIIDPVSVTSPAAGLLTGYANFGAFKAASLPSVLLADDFESPGPFDTGFTPAATRTLNTATGTTYARGTIQGGGSPGSGTSSLDNNKAFTAGTGTRGAPDVVRPELFGHYAWYMESSFGTQQDDAIKIPAMGVQFGVWNPAGYWQQTTGNGGSRGTGLKVDNGGASNFEYQGHSVRLLTGTAPKAGDDDPYTGWFGVGVYPYNLDQVQDFPEGEAVPYVALRREAWYDIDIRVKQNSVSGTQDALGNWSVANADGIYQIWINGYLAYSKTTFRWRRHLEFGVQGLWLDVYHGGQSPALVDMHYRIDRVAVATQYIGPSAPLLPAWVPAPGDAAVLSVANGKLTNSLNSVWVSYYDTFYAHRIVSDYSTTVLNPHYGQYGALVLHGGGHSGTNDNTIAGLVLNDTGGTFVRWVDPTPHYGSAPGNAFANSSTSDGNLANNTHGENISDGKPASIHSYGIGDVLSPANGGAVMGTYVRAAAAAVNQAGFKSTRALHSLPFPGVRNAAAANPAVWARRGNNPSPFANNTNSEYAPVWTCLVPSQNRIYTVNVNTLQRPQWWDLNTNTHVIGTGTALDMTIDGDGGNGINQGALFHVPARNLLLFICRSGGAMRIQALDTTQAQPSWSIVGTPSVAISLPVTWSAGCWCEDNNRVIVGNIAGDANAVYELEIPTNLAASWPATRRPIGGAAINWYTQCGPKKWTYNPKTKCIPYYPFGSQGGQDVVYAYRPFGT